MKILNIVLYFWLYIEIHVSKFDDFYFYLVSFMAIEKIT
jgi:hypothetical protein